MTSRRSRRDIALDYLVSVVESNQADPLRRDAAARELLKQNALPPAARPAKTPKRASPAPTEGEDPAPAAAPAGKKEQLKAAAETAGVGTKWENKL